MCFYRIAPTCLTGLALSKVGVIEGPSGFPGDTLGVIGPGRAVFGARATTPRLTFFTLCYFVNGEAVRAGVGASSGRS